MNGIFPNPFNSEININLNNIVNGNVEVRIIDINGRVVAELNQNTNSTTNNITVNTTTIDKGMYFIEVIVGGEKSVHKIIKE